MSLPSHDPMSLTRRSFVARNDLRREAPHLTPRISLCRAQRNTLRQFSKPRRVHEECCAPRFLYVIMKPVSIEISRLSRYQRSSTQTIEPTPQPTSHPPTLLTVNFMARSCLPTPKSVSCCYFDHRSLSIHRLSRPHTLLQLRRAPRR